MWPCSGLPQLSGGQKTLKSETVNYEALKVELRFCLGCEFEPWFDCGTQSVTPNRRRRILQEPWAKWGSIPLGSLCDGAADSNITATSPPELPSQAWRASARPPACARHASSRRVTRTFHLTP